MVARIVLRHRGAGHRRPALRCEVEVEIRAGQAPARRSRVELVEAGRRRSQDAIDIDSRSGDRSVDLAQVLSRGRVERDTVRQHPGAERFGHVVVLAMTIREAPAAAGSFVVINLETLQRGQRRGQPADGRGQSGRRDLVADFVGGGGDVADRQRADQADGGAEEREPGQERPPNGRPSRARRRRWPDQRVQPTRLFTMLHPPASSAANRLLAIRSPLA